MELLKLGFVRTISDQNYLYSVAMALLVSFLLMSITSSSPVPKILIIKIGFENIFHTIFNLFTVLSLQYVLAKLSLVIGLANLTLFL